MLTQNRLRDMNEARYDALATLKWKKGSVAGDASA
jgi:hypothetical protein